MSKLETLAFITFATIAILYLLFVIVRHLDRAKAEPDSAIIGDASLLGREELREKPKRTKAEAEPRGA